ncbi:hypothetical protein [Niallia oryzisoli]|uniref:hypothetical protein n=1 Tax=Niallia oryzisoli TaxID=1737571 RepID=UPI003736D661
MKRSSITLGILLFLMAPTTTLAQEPSNNASQTPMAAVETETPNTPAEVQANEGLSTDLQTNDNTAIVEPQSATENEQNANTQSDSVTVEEPAANAETEQPAVSEPIKESENAVATGWQERDGQWYYYDESGSLLANQWIQDNSTWFYVQEDGARVSNRTMDINGKGYFFDTDGSMASNGWATDGNYWYYAREDGTLWTGWFDYNGQKYFLGEFQYNGYGGPYGYTMRTGHLKIEEKHYYFDSSGALVSNIGWLQDANNNSYYYGNGDGSLYTGWLFNNGQWYYMNPTMYSNTQAEINGKTYHFNQDGVMASNRWVMYGYWNYAKENGELHTGWLFDNGRWYHLGRYIDNPYYYMYPDYYPRYIYHPYYMATGQCIIDGKLYFFDSSGAMVTTTGWFKNDNNWYYGNGDGTLYIGWQFDNGYWYYLNGSMYKNTYASINGKTYFFDKSGAMATNGWVTDDYSWFYALNSGELYAGWLSYGGNSYLLDDSGRMVTGWLPRDNKWYFLDSSGAMKTGWVHSGYSWYYMDSSGAMQTGWLTIDGQKYYFDESGARVTGYKTIDSKEHYFDSVGVLQY